MTKKQPKKTTSNRDRVVYEVKGPQGGKQVEATTTAELKNALLPLLPLDPYALQAAAHLAHTECAAITGNGWSIRRLGVLSFVPDSTTSAPQRTAQPVEAETPAPDTSTTEPTAPPQE